MRSVVQAASRRSLVSACLSRQLRKAPLRGSAVSMSQRQAPSNHWDCSGLRGRGDSASDRSHWLVMLREQLSTPAPPQGHLPFLPGLHPHSREGLAVSQSAPASQTGRTVTHSQAGSRMDATAIQRALGVSRPPPAGAPCLCAFSRPGERRGGWGMVTVPFHTNPHGLVHLPRN